MAWSWSKPLRIAATPIQTLPPKQHVPSNAVVVGRLYQSALTTSQRITSVELRKECLKFMRDKSPRRKENKNKEKEKLQEKKEDTSCIRAFV
ncbi:hypothetical protein V1478_001826 [Vespula squamosa]|uniref:Uncharacterized protein n=1 Tax=Vespula squamosa TaxID=30214 RepID=A0ABD2BYS3_VESSQ